MTSEFLRLMRILVLICTLFLLTMVVIAQTDVPATPTLTPEAAIEEFREVFDPVAQDDSVKYVLSIAFLPILILAGLSDAAAQSVVLFANRVKPARFALLIFVNVLTFIFGYFVWVFSIWVYMKVFVEVELALPYIIIAVGLAYLPLMFSFLSIIPYFGNYIYSGLLIFSFLVIAQNMQLFFELPTTQAYMSALFGLVFTQVLRLTVGRPIIFIFQKFRDLVAGTRFESSVERALSRAQKTSQEN